MKNEIHKVKVINAICKDEITIIRRAEKLFNGSILFIDKSAYKEAQICNNEGIQLLNKILFKVRQNKEFLKNKLAV